MTTAIAGNRSVGLTLGFALLMMGMLVAVMRAPLARTDWTGGAPAVSTVPQLDITATVTPSPVEHLDRVTLVTTFRAPAEVQEALAARVEVVGQSQGSPVLVMSQSGFRAPVEEARAVYWEWRVPGDLPEGEYTLRVRVTGQESGKSYGEDLQAATFRVVAR